MWLCGCCPAKDPPPGLKVVITGGSQGLGFHLARHFLKAGDDVVINSRSAASLEAALQQLAEEFPGQGRVLGVAGNVSQPAVVEELAAACLEQLGRIDVWICNAAQSASAKAPVANTSTDELQAIVSTNLVGVLLCARAAIKHMAAQEGGGKVFLVDGRGSGGSATPGNAVYGATKAGVAQLKKSLAKEVKGSSVSVHIFSPGMVATDLLLRYATNPMSAKLINILAEDPSTVAAWLVPRIRGRFVPEGAGAAPRAEGYEHLLEEG